MVLKSDYTGMQRGHHPATTQPSIMSISRIRSDVCPKYKHHNHTSGASAGTAPVCLGDIVRSRHASRALAEISLCSMRLSRNKSQTLNPVC